MWIVDYVKHEVRPATEEVYDSFVIMKREYGVVYKICNFYIQSFHKTETEAQQALSNSNTLNFLLKQ